MIILEGGNVFKDADGNPQTQRINKQDVQPTVGYLEKLTGLPLLQNMLGSTGIAQSSGDLDLAVDDKSMSKEELYNKLAQHVTSQGLDPKDYIAKSGVSVHYRTPINGQALNGFVQTDFMFGDSQWQKWAMAGAPEGSEFKGKHRAILLSSIAKGRNLKFSVQNGLLTRDTNKLVTKDPKEIARILVGGTEKDLASVESIIKKVKTDPDYEQLVADAKETFAKDGLNLDAMTEANFMRQLRDRIVNQGMSLIIEAARIEHPEDEIFNDGENGALRAIEQLINLPQRAQDITIKWDGKPAIIFGRDTDGKFVLTDKSGFTAKTYSGMAKTPEELEKVMQMRGGDRADLINMYKALWKPLESQTPAGLEGFFQGDLLYVGTPQKKGNKYVFTPNTVTYSVDADTDLGKQIANSQAAVAVHTYKTGPQDSGQPFHAVEKLPKGSILFVGPKMKDTPNVDVPTGKLEQLAKTVRDNHAAIGKLFDPMTLRQQQISNLPALMKQFANFKVREGNFNNMAGNFTQWALTKVSEGKGQRLAQYVNDNVRAVELVFKVFNAIAVIKTQIVRSLDKQGGGISATVDGESGHEGYVAGGLKYVDRLRFSRSNFAKNLQ